MLKRPESELNVQAILELADFIEKLPDHHLRNIGDARQEYTHKKVNAFNMGIVATKVRGCGTVCCITGTAEVLFKESLDEDYDGDSVQEYLGLTDEQADELFMPDGYTMNIYKSEDAAKVLRHLALTNEVDWSIVKESQ
jgi:hypothetical protein